MQNPEKCPTCGEKPLVRFCLAGQTAFFPVIEMHINCEKCYIGMASIVCHDETSFLAMDKKIESLIEQWNRRAEHGRSA